MNRVLLVIYIVIILLLTYELYVAEVYRAESRHKFDRNLLPSPSTANQPAAAQSDRRPAAPTSNSAETVALGAKRELNAFRDINADTSSFDLHEARMLGAKAFESDVIMIDSPPIVMPPMSTIIPPGTTVTRVSSSSAGGATNTTSTITGGTIERPLVDPPAPTPPVVVSPVPAADSERPDHRCGPLANGAKCGPGRCCSIYGWCGSPGEPHCNVGINVPVYNGAGLPLPQGLSNGDVVKCANGAIYRLEDNQKRLYPSLSVYEKYGKPVATNIDCKLLDTVIPGISFV